MEPRYYRQPLERISLRKWLRFYKGYPRLKVFLKWVDYRKKHAEPSALVIRLPSLFQDVQASREAVSSRCFFLIETHIKELETLGFRIMSFVKPGSTHLAYTVFDSGGCWMLHTSGEYVGQIGYARFSQEASAAWGTEIVEISLKTGFQSGKVVGVSNQMRHFDPLPKTRVFVLRSASPTELFAALKAKVSRKFAADPPLKFESLEELASWQDARSTQLLQSLLNRRLLIPLTPEEVEETKSKAESLSPR